MDKNSIEKLVEDTIQSFDGAKRAEPKPFLFTRVMASINKYAFTGNIWSRIGAFISRPRIAIPVILLIMLVNTSIFFLHKKNIDKPSIVQNNATVTDEFAINAGNIYDFENPE